MAWVLSIAAWTSSVTNFREVVPAQHARAGLQGVGDAVICPNVDRCAIHHQITIHNTEKSIAPERRAIARFQREQDIILPYIHRTIAHRQCMRVILSGKAPEPRAVTR